MESTGEQLSRQRCERARRARDARFDGRFFTAVKTTGIYCRPICPANQPLEKNVDYYASAISAAQAGFRPCLRCRPDSAPNSWAWLGAQTTFQRGLSLIQDGALQRGNLSDLSARLGISDRYLRELFQQNLGTSPKKYAIYQQCLFAKQLLHESALPITQIAFASGFNSVRRFNEAMQQQMSLSPRQIRQSDKVVSGNLSLKLYYRPPFAWGQMRDFLERRAIPELEWVDGDCYGRTLRYQDCRGWLEVRPELEQNHLVLTLYLDSYQHLNTITQRIKSMFDVDAPIAAIDSQLCGVLPAGYQPGLRIPGIWSRFEAGVRAILGQQVSVTAARNLVQQLVAELGDKLTLPSGQQRRLFPTPAAIAGSELEFLRMPGARKDTLRRLGQHELTSDNAANIDDWLNIKGIGPWTVAYVKMRSAKDPDVWLAGDAGIRSALAVLQAPLDIEAAQPWRSYLTFQLWNQL